MKTKNVIQVYAVPIKRGGRAIARELITCENAKRARELAQVKLRVEPHYSGATLGRVTVSKVHKIQGELARGFLNSLALAPKSSLHGQGEAKTLTVDRSIIEAARDALADYTRKDSQYSNGDYFKNLKTVEKLNKILK